MIDIIEMEFNKFKEEYIIGLRMDKSNNYLKSDNYEDEYSGREINNAQYTLMNLIEDYLKVNADTNYRIYYDWCVHVIHSDFDEKLNRESKLINKRHKEFLDSKNKPCEFCECNDLEGFNHDLINEYTEDNIGVSLEIIGNTLEVEVDLGDKVVNRSIEINNCPICRRKF